MKRKLFALVLASSAVGLVACSADSGVPAETTVVKTVEPTTATSSPASSTPPDTSAESESAEIIGSGSTEIASCGDPTMYESGTTFFVDGTSGCTQYCQNSMAAAIPQGTAPAPTFDQQAYNEQFAKDYWATHPRPTFDPDSADGYGPNQELPPASLRLVGVDC